MLAIQFMHFAFNRNLLTTVSLTNPTGEQRSPLGDSVNWFFYWRIHMSRINTIHQINELGRMVAKMAMGSFGLFCLGLLLLYVGLPTGGKWVTLTGTTGMILAALCFRSLLKLQDRVIRNFVLTYRNGDRLMGFMARSA